LGHSDYTQTENCRNRDRRGKSVVAIVATRVREHEFLREIITIGPGFPVRVIVNRDLVLAPYRS
jgi:hypothetical protein